MIVTLTKTTVGTEIEIENTDTRSTTTTTKAAKAANADESKASPADDPPPLRAPVKALLPAKTKGRRVIAEIGIEIERTCLPHPFHRTSPLPRM